MWRLSRLAAVLVLLILAAPAWGQSGLPPFPQTLPANSVVGRIGAGQAGPAEAIPFVTLSAQLNTIGYGNIAANKVFAGPSTGAATTPGFRSLVGADLPNPAASTLGGVESISCAGSNWINTISTSGVPSCTQPAFSDISGVPTATSAQKGIVQGDGSTLIITAGTIACQTATSSQIGCSRPDGTTISASSGVLTAIGTAAASISVGVTTVSNQVHANDFLTTNTTLADPGYGPAQIAHLSGCVNCGISAVASTNNILFTLTDQSGNAISATNPAVGCFRNDSTTNGEVSCLNITSGPTLQLNASSNLGVTGTTQAFRVWLALFNDAGTVRLGAIVAVGYTAPVSVLSLNETGVASSTTCSSCGTATAAKTWYSTVGVTSKPFRIIGYVDFPAFSTNGNWITATGVHMCNWGCVLPGRSTGNTVTAVDNSGDAGTNSTSYAVNTAMEISIIPSSASNLVRVTMTGIGSFLVGSTFCSARIIRGTSGSTQVGGYQGWGGGAASSVMITGLDAPSTASSQTYAGERASVTSGTTCAWPSPDAPATGANYGYMTAEEIQG